MTTSSPDQAPIPADNPPAPEGDAAAPAQALDAPPPAQSPLPKRVLVIDIGGTKLKILATGQTEPRKTPSGKKMTPTDMVAAVKELAKDWEYEAISIGFP